MAFTDYINYTQEDNKEYEEWYWKMKNKGHCMEEEYYGIDAWYSEYKQNEESERINEIRKKLLEKE